MHWKKGLKQYCHEWCGKRDAHFILGWKKSEWLNVRAPASRAMGGGGNV